MRQITKEQRYTISTILTQGYSKQKIADCIGKNKSSIYREIHRNKDNRNGNYRDCLAEKKCRERHRYKKKHIGFTQKIRENVEALLKEDYSPEQVVGYCKKLGLTSVSPERIYQHIWEDKKQKGTLYSHLRRQGRKYRKRGNKKDTRGIIVGRIGIEKRPKIVEKRERFGDLEVDLIIGKNHKQVYRAIKSLRESTIFRDHIGIILFYSSFFNRKELP